MSTARGLAEGVVAGGWRKQPTRDLVLPTEPATTPLVAGLGSRVYAVGFCVLAAAVVDGAFGPAFVQDPVAYGSAAYCVGLAMAFFGGVKDARRWVDRRWVRALVGASCASLSVLLLRGPLLVSLPWSDYQLSGYSPWVVFLVGLLLAELALAIAGRVVRRSEPQ